MGDFKAWSEENDVADFDDLSDEKDSFVVVFSGIGDVAEWSSSTLAHSSSVKRSSRSVLILSKTPWEFDGQ